MTREQPVSARVHFHTEYPNRAYCGAALERSTPVTEDRSETTCPNCGAALRADEEARS
jgi:predicted RNA-binding Zn-ribbon protein involved in translation (DUF1610 family)